MASRTLRQIAGTLVYDWPRFAWAMRRGGSDPRLAPWIRMRNRRDRLISGAGGVGVKCDWEYTRPIYLCDVFPVTGRWLMNRALQGWPVRFRESPQATAAEKPDVSFVIGHRGLERLPHILRTLESIAGQEGVALECIVVEQDSRPLIQEHLPAWVRHILAPPPDANMPYCRSWAFNVGVRAAQGPLLILHDGDLLVPASYAAETVLWSRNGYEVMNLKRFIFYLDSSSGADAEKAGAAFLGRCKVETVLENAEGGGSVAIGRKAYEEIGGFDEEFLGWGGEDNEFWDRCLTRRVYPFAYLPLVHLWHESQAGKRAANGNGLLTAELAERRRAIPPAARIAELAQRNWGQREKLSLGQGVQAATVSAKE